MKPISEETYNNVVSLLDRGLSAHKIATELSVSHATIDRVHAKSRSNIQKVRVGSQLNLNQQISVD